MQTVTSVQICYSDLLTCKVNTCSTVVVYSTETQCSSLLLMLALDENYQVRKSHEHLLEYVPWSFFTAVGDILSLLPVSTSLPQFCLEKYREQKGFSAALCKHHSCLLGILAALPRAHRLVSGWTGTTRGVPTAWPSTAKAIPQARSHTCISYPPLLLDKQLSRSITFFQ